MLLTIKANKDGEVVQYVREINDKLSKDSDFFRNPLAGRIVFYNLKDSMIIVLSLKLLAFPPYLLLPFILFFVYFWGNIFTYSILVIFIIASIPFTASFWYAFFMLGLRKKGCKQKLKRISPSKAWREYIGTD